MRNIYWIDPAKTAIHRPTELPARVIISVGAPSLILKSVAGAVCFIDREPLFVASGSRRQKCERLTTIDGPPDIIKKIIEQAKIIELPGTIGVQHWITAEHVVLQDTGERPG